MGLTQVPGAVARMGPEGEYHAIYKHDLLPGLEFTNPELEFAIARAFFRQYRLGTGMRPAAAWSAGRGTAGIWIRRRDPLANLRRPPGGPPDHMLFMLRRYLPR